MKDLWSLDMGGCPPETPSGAAVLDRAGASLWAPHPGAHPCNKMRHPSQCVGSRLSGLVLVASGCGYLTTKWINWGLCPKDPKRPEQERTGRGARPIKKMIKYNRKTKKWASLFEARATKTNPKGWAQIPQGKSKKVSHWPNFPHEKFLEIWIFLPESAFPSGVSSRKASCYLKLPRYVLGALGFPKNIILLSYQNSWAFLTKCFC